MSRSKNYPLAASVALNVLLVILLLASRRPARVGRTSSEQTTIDRLTLAIRCGEGKTEACNELDVRDRKECDDGSGHACTLLAIGYETGKSRPKDPARAAEYYRKACDLGDGAGCWYAGIHLWRGQGVPQDREAAMPLLVKACDLKQENGCLDLGDAYAGATPPDTAKARAAWDRGCKLGYGTACDRAAQ